MRRASVVGRGFSRAATAPPKGRPAHTIEKASSRAYLPPAATTVLRSSVTPGISTSNVSPGFIAWVVPGVLCAIVYLAMSLPLSWYARRLERRLSTT